jgi:peroxiredoxin
LTNLGQPMQDLVFTTLDGKEMQLSTLKGKVILLDFWGVWCGVCTHDLPNLQAIHDRHKDDPNFVMISLSVDDEPARIREFLKDHRMPWTIGVLGPRDQAWGAKLYGVTGYPTYWLIAADGKIAANGNFTNFLESLVATALNEANVARASSP